MERIDVQPWEPGTQVHLILDNYGAHQTPRVKRWFAKRPYYHLHFTPTGASWLNLVERFFAEITNKRIRRGVFRGVNQLEQAIRSYRSTQRPSAPLRLDSDRRSNPGTRPETL